MSNALVSHKLGSLRASRTGLMTEADQAKRLSAWIYWKGNATMYQSRKGDFHQPKSWITVARPN